MQRIEVTRQMGPTEVAEVTALTRAVEVADGHAPLGERSLAGLEAGAGQEAVGLLARDGRSGRLVGYAQLVKGPTSWSVELAVHPEVDHGSSPLRTRILRSVLAELARLGGGRLYLWVPVAGEEDDEIAQQVGLRVDRELVQMRRSIPLEPGLDAAADKVPTRPFRPGRDEAALLAVNNAAFADHPEQGSWDRATLLEREAQPWFDPDGLLLAEDEEGLAGFCWTKVLPGSAAGEIYVLGVDPSRQGAGLGQVLLAAGCRHLSEQRLSTVELYVDAENTSAVRLYEGAGFTVHHRDRSYVADVAAEGSGASR